MDVFAEQIVRKPTDGKTAAFKIIIALAAAVVTALSLILMLMGLAFAMFIIFGAIYAAYFFITNLDAEYEYIVTNGEMDVDKIIAKRKRKRLITAKAASFERFGKLSDAPETESGVTIVKAAGIPYGGADTEEFYADFTHSAVGSVRLIFSPEEKIIESLKPFFNRTLRAEFERARRSEN